MKRGIASIAVFAAALAGLLSSAPMTTSAQDVQVQAPAFAVGDETNTIDDRGIEYSVITEMYADGFLVRSLGDNGATWLYRYDSQVNVREWISETGTRRMMFDPYYPKYKFPMYVGSDWSGRYTTTLSRSIDGASEVIETKHVSVSCEALCIERLTVPAGMFEAFKISCDLNRETDRARERLIYWYAPAVGVTVRSETLDAETGRQMDFYELHSYVRTNTAAFDVLPDGVESTCDLTISLNEQAP